MNNIEDVTKLLNNKYNISRETLSILEKYVILLQKWNKAINLIRYDSSYSIWERHILDSAQLIDYIDKNAIVADLGSGAGLPGIILSIIGVKHISLIEADSRKATFLYQASLLSNNKINIINKRIEEIDILDVDIITSRALCNIEKLFTFIARFQKNVKILLLKGKTIMEEVNEAANIWSFDYILYPSITSNDSFIIEISNLKHKTNE